MMATTTHVRFRAEDVLVVEHEGGATSLLVGCGPHTNQAGVARLLRRLEQRSSSGGGRQAAAKRKGGREDELQQLERFVESLPPASEVPLRRVAIVRDLFDRDEAERPHLSSVLKKTAHENVVAMARSVAGRDSLRRRLVNEHIPHAVVDDGAGEATNSRQEFKLMQASVELQEYLERCLRLRVVLLDDHELTTGESLKMIPSESATQTHGLQIQAVMSISPRTWDTSRATVASRTTGTILMVAPIGFQLNEETAQDNHFMHKVNEESTKIERKALAEFSNLHRALTDAGVSIILHAPERHHNTPDAVFPNNWFSTHSAAESGCPTVVYYPMKTPSRRAERRQSIVAELQEVYEREFTFEHWENADPPRFLESTGVLILDRLRKVAYAALSQRCSKRVALQWGKRMGYKMCLFRAVDARDQPIYHTNVLMAVGTSVAVVCLESVADLTERADLERTLRESHELVEITRAQIDEFCGNVLEVRGTGGKRVLAMSSRAYAAFTEDQKAVLHRHVDEVVQVPIPTIETIGGGGVRCMMAEIF